MERKQSFAPVVSERSRVLILGSLPGAESLRRQQYYANRQNAFWRLIYALFESEPSADYDERLAFILSRGLALWDVCGSAERAQGSSDSKIAAVLPNDISGLLRTFLNIQRVLLNGRRAESEYRKHFSGIQIPAVYVPSTSPALAAMSFEAKLCEWEKALLAGT